MFRVPAGQSVDRPGQAASPFRGAARPAPEGRHGQLRDASTRRLRGGLTGITALSALVRDPDPADHPPGAHMNRRTFLEIGLSSAGVAPCPPRDPRGRRSKRGTPLWPCGETWQERHLDYAGRVGGRHAIGAQVTSRGAGLRGMLLAAEFGDRDAFRRMFDWTEANLAIRSRSNCWHGDGCQTCRERVPDLNNASDGDLFLCLGARRRAARTVRRDAVAGPCGPVWPPTWRENARSPGPIVPVGRSCCRQNTALSKAIPSW